MSITSPNDKETCPPHQTTHRVHHSWYGSLRYKDFDGFTVDPKSTLWAELLNFRFIEASNVFPEGSN